VNTRRPGSHVPGDSRRVAWQFARGGQTATDWPPVGLLVACIVAIAGAAHGGAVGWRGDGTGCYPSAAPPTEWDIDEGTNILWKTEIGKGQSSPVVVGDRIFVTVEQDALLCLDRQSGKVLWTRDNGFGALPAATRPPEKRHPSAPNCGYSSPTPVSDGALVYSSHGTGIVAAYRFDGTLQWIQYFDRQQATQYGRSASPRLVGGKLLVSLGGLIALDPATGKILWEAADAKPTYGTPTPAKIGDVEVIITPIGDCVRLADGKILAAKLAKTTYTSPLVHDGVAYFVHAPTVAVKLPEKPGEPFRPEPLWENDDVEGGFFASPILHDGILYCVSNEGVLYALDAKTGKLVFDKELEIASAAGTPGRPQGNIYASPILVGKLLFLTNDVGETLVLTPGREYKELAHNFLDKGAGGSPVADGKLLFLRGGKKLYCIGKPEI